MKARDRYDGLFQHYAESNPIGTVDWVAIKAQAIAESNLDPWARSHAGAVGLMQFMAPTWAEWWARLHPSRPMASRTDAERSIELGSAYMAELIRRFGHIVTARAAYNYGMGNVKRHMDARSGRLVIGELPTETQQYVARIDRIYGELLAEMGG